MTILLVKPKNDKENNNNDKVALNTMKMKWNNKQKNVARASTWSSNLIMKKIAKQTRKTRWIVMIISMADWIAKSKEYTSAHGKK